MRWLTESAQSPLSPGSIPADSTMFNSVHNISEVVYSEDLGSDGGKLYLDRDGYLWIQDVGEDAICLAGTRDELDQLLARLATLRDRLAE